MTLDIFFDRYLITVHAIVVAFGLILYVAAARALPQRRDPSAAIAWVIALTLLPYVALPLYFMFGSRKLRMRDAAAAGAAGGRRRGRRGRGRLALGPPPRPLDGPGAGRRLSEPAHPRRRRRGARRRARADRRRDPDDRRLHLHPRHRRLGDEIAQALRSQAERGVKVRLLIDGIGAWLGGRLDMKALSRSGVAGREVRAAVPLDPARPRQPAQPPQDASSSTPSGCGAAAATSPPSTSRAIRSCRQPRNQPWHDLSFDLRGELVATPASCSRRTGPMRPARRSRTPCPARGIAASDAPLAQLVPSGPEQVDDTVQSLLVSGCFMARRRVAGGHALLHSRRHPADGADAGGAPRRADRHRPAAPLEPSPRRRRPASAAARPRAPPARGSGSSRTCSMPRPWSSTTSSPWSARPTSTCAASSSTTS